MPELSLNLRVDEVSVLPQVGSASDVRHSPSSCFAELMRHSADPAHVLFPDARADHGGEVPPPEWWSSDLAHISDLHLFKIRDAILLPGSGVVVAANGDVMRLTMEEASYGSDDLTHLPRVSRRAQGPVLDVPDDMPRFSEAVVVLPYGAVRNYGHFLFDGLASLAAIASTEVFDDHPVLVPPLEPWQARHFALFGTAPTIVTTEAVRVDAVVYTSAMHHFLHRPNFNYRDLRDRQMANAELAPGGGGRRRLYLSRGSGSRRVMRQERRLVARLQRAGFDIVDPGRMSVDEQIALFADAEAVIGTAGAAFANALYCRRGTLIVEIQPQGMQNLWVLRLCQILGLHHAAYFCRSSEADAEHPEHDLAFDIDVDRFLAFAFGFAPLQGSMPRPSLMRRFNILTGG